MKLDEAMADLSIQLEVKRRLGQDRQADAIKLGIEALKVIEAMRRIAVLDKDEPLLGETK